MSEYRLEKTLRDKVFGESSNISSFSELGKSSYEPDVSTIMSSILNEREERKNFLGSMWAKQTAEEDKKFRDSLESDRRATIKFQAFYAEAYNRTHMLPGYQYMSIINLL